MQQELFAMWCYSNKTILLPGHTLPLLLSTDVSSWILCCGSWSSCAHISELMTADFYTTEGSESIF